MGEDDSRLVDGRRVPSNQSLSRLRIATMA